MTKNTKRIIFTDYLANAQRISYLPILEASEAIINKSLDNDTLNIVYDTEKLKAHAKKMKKLSNEGKTFNYLDILATQYANNIIEMSVDVV